MLKPHFLSFVFMEPPRSFSSSESPPSLRLTLMRREPFAFQPALTNVALVLALVSGALFLGVRNPEIIFYAGSLSLFLVAFGLGAALLNVLVSGRDRQRAGEIAFHPGACTLRLGADTWTLSPDRVRAVRLNISPSSNGEPRQQAWGNEVTLVQEGRLVTFRLREVPSNARAVLASLQVAHSVVQAPWWQQPTGAFVLDELKGWPGG